MSAHEYSIEIDSDAPNTIKLVRDALGQLRIGTVVINARDGLYVAKLWGPGNETTSHDTLMAALDYLRSEAL